MEKLRRTVAVVDDDASLRRSLGRLLNAYGFLAEEYVSAEDFLARDRKKPIDCLVLDIDLGGMSGIDLQRRLKAEGSVLPVIFITALESGAVKAEAEKVGCVTYLQKQFSGAALIAAINNALA
ncbi:response regulator transcription factor [Rhizobium laguerreae]|uniref:FixJ family two-component response regulator n=1 Tax=Rhizobium laguerreae TaxID=1076926 RepID=A0ABR6GIR3_9HYPH|nr:response regulator [Rhizobium laguerreae]MBB3166189.1 FixJ family two-component response regulator [Rhizobium laguerreae]MBY3543840.1 response regulator [Rhizobium laguerreae]MBY3550469.1 response regulator [Rhizobium laguerreae]MBY3568328.1 response regulator [Rhizobium laguerreae]NKM84732.1 response regulator [Rhizobium laguerreae]